MKSTTIYINQPGVKSRGKEATNMATCNSNSIDVKVIETKHFLLIMPGETPGRKMGNL